MSVEQGVAIVLMLWAPVVAVAWIIASAVSDRRWRRMTERERLDEWNKWRRP